MYKHTKIDHHHRTEVQLNGELRRVEFNFSDFNRERAWVSIWDDTDDRYVSTLLTLQDLKELRRAINQEIKLLTEADHD